MQISIHQFVAIGHVLSLYRPFARVAAEKTSLNGERAPVRIARAHFFFAATAYDVTFSPDIVAGLEESCPAHLHGKQASGGPSQ